MTARLRRTSSPSEVDGERTKTPTLVYAFTVGSAFGVTALTMAPFGATLWLNPTGALASRYGW